MRNILDWDFEEWIGAFTLAVIAGLIAIAGLAICSDSTPVGYYIGGRQASPANLTCVYSNRPWSEDSEVYCSVDPQQAIAVLAKVQEVKK